MKGHQDDDDTYNNIYEWIQMNIEADRIVKYYIWHKINEVETHQPHEAISGAIQPTNM